MQSMQRGRVYERNTNFPPGRGCSTAGSSCFAVCCFPPQAASSPGCSVPFLSRFRSARRLPLGVFADEHCAQPDHHADDASLWPGSSGVCRCSARSSAARLCCHRPSVLLSFARSLVVFYVLSALCGFFSCFMNAVPIVILTSNWFVEKRGVATSISFSGMGLSACCSRARRKADRNQLLADRLPRGGHCLLPAQRAVVCVLVEGKARRLRPAAARCSPCGGKRTADSLRFLP